MILRRQGSSFLILVLLTLTSRSAKRRIPPPLRSNNLNVLPKLKSLHCSLGDEFMEEEIPFFSLSLREDDDDDDGVNTLFFSH